MPKAPPSLLSGPSKSPRSLSPSLCWACCFPEPGVFWLGFVLRDMLQCNREGVRLWSPHSRQVIRKDIRDTGYVHCQSHLVKHHDWIEGELPRDHVESGGRA